MMRINFKKVGIFILIISAILFLKKGYVPYLYDDDYINYIKNLLIFDGENILYNIIWFMPFIIIFYFSTLDICYDLKTLNLRYGNRKKFVINSLLKLVVRSFIITSNMVLLHIIIFNYKFNFSFKLLYVIIYYITLCMSLNFIIVILFLIIKRYIYSICIAVILIFIFCNILRLQFTLLPVMLLILMICTILIYKIYLYSDLGGEEE